MTALHALLDGLIDYAGVFPPAALDMTTAVHNYDSYRRSEHAYALGNFVVPAQRLEEFANAFDEACCAEQDTPWLLSVISHGSMNEMQRIADFDEGAAWVRAVEIKADDPAAATHTLALVPAGADIYVEFAQEKVEQMLPVLKKFQAKAKIRTGGIAPENFPSVEQLAHLLVSCAREQVAFKATAGLHHPLRAAHKLTYEPDSVSAIMHGFINVYAAAVMAYAGAGEAETSSMLQERSADAFQWSHDALTWRGHRFSTSQIAKTRANFAISFGSCSFDEPIDDLKQIGWLR